MDSLRLNSSTTLSTLTSIISYAGDKKIEIIQDIWLKIFFMLMTQEKKSLQLVAKGFRLTMKNFLDSSMSNSSLFELGFFEKNYSQSTFGEAIDNAHSKFGKAIDYAHTLNLNIVNLSLIPSIDAEQQSLSKLTSAQELLLGSTHVNDKAMESIASLTKLKTLHLIGAQITKESAPFIGCLTNLETLALAHSTFCEKGIIMIAQRLTKLRDLQLPSSGSVEVFNAIAELPNLTSLSFINKISGISETDLEVLSAKFNHLQKLVWKENELNDEQLEIISKNLINLRHLDLSKSRVSTSFTYPTLTTNPTNITNKGVIALAKNCTSLESINISHCRVGDAGVTALAENCPALQHINISNTDVGDEGIQNLLEKQLPLKSILTFGCNNITSEYLKSNSDRLNKFF